MYLEDKTSYEVFINKLLRFYKKCNKQCKGCKYNNESESDDIKHCQIRPLFEFV